MDKKTKIALAVIKKVYDKFPETQKFIDKANVEECCKENISVNKVFFSINNNNFFFVLCCYVSLWFVMKHIIFFYIL